MANMPNSANWHKMNKSDNTNNESALMKWFQTKIMMELEQKHDQIDKDDNDKTSDKNAR